jgi:hypothetical protein
VVYVLITLELAPYSVLVSVCAVVVVVMWEGLIRYRSVLLPVPTAEPPATGAISVVMAEVADDVAVVVLELDFGD